MDRLPSVPAELLAVARRPAYNGSVVKVSVSGEDLLCVIGDEGGRPADWYAVLRAYVERAPWVPPQCQLPRGLRAMAIHDHHEVLLCVSVMCTAAEQKAAVRKLVRAARRHDWLPAALPRWLVPLAAAWDSARGRVSAHPGRSALAAAGALIATAALVTALGNVAT